MIYNGTIISIRRIAMIMIISNDSLMSIRCYI